MNYWRNCKANNRYHVQHMRQLLAAADAKLPITLPRQDLPSQLESAADVLSMFSCTRFSVNRFRTAVAKSQEPSGGPHGGNSTTCLLKSGKDLTSYAHKQAGLGLAFQRTPTRPGRAPYSSCFPADNSLLCHSSSTHRNTLHIFRVLHYGFSKHKNRKPNSTNRNRNANAT